MKIIPVPNRRILKLIRRCTHQHVTPFTRKTQLVYGWLLTFPGAPSPARYLIDNQQARINRALSHFRRPLPGPVAEPNPHGYLPTPHGDLPSLLRYERTWRARDPYAAVRTRIRRNLTGVW